MTNIQDAIEILKRPAYIHTYALDNIADALKALQALVQQGDQQPVAWRAWLLRMEWSDWHFDRFGDSQAHCPDCGNQREDGHEQGCELAAMLAAAPAAQPTCKQDLQVPTVKENLSVETEQELYVRMCPDIECGRKKKCTRMVGVSCMSRADIAPAAQPDASKVIEQMVEVLGKSQPVHIPNYTEEEWIAVQMDYTDAIASGQQWLEVNK